MAEAWQVNWILQENHKIYSNLNKVVNAEAVDLILAEAGRREM